MKLKVYRAETKARVNGHSTISTIPVAMTQILGIEQGTTLIWELDPEEGIMKVYSKEE